MLEKIEQEATTCSLKKKDRVYNSLDKAHPPAATVKPGDTVRIQTQLQSGSWLNSVEDRWGPSKS